jgi:radical SAM protein with 4Fe4S-binding SPASM domain
VTPLLTDDALAELSASGVKRIAMSLDGVDAETHDHFRGVVGTFARTMSAITTAKRLGMEVQINTTVSEHNVHQVPEIARLVGWLDATLWSVFQVVPTGRAAASEDAIVLQAGAQERLYRLLANIALNPETPFDIKTTAGQPYYRVLAQERQRRGQQFPHQHEIKRSLRAPRGVNDGNGFVFISHTGAICPSGFLPIEAGNVRTHSLSTVYRHHDLFTRLRQPKTFTGKCGHCEFNDRCGGSRSRTYAITGDAFASDPTCVYQPKELTAIAN